MQASERISNYYSDTRNDSTIYPELHAEQHADVVVVGAGSTGIATAVELAERGLDVIVVEANRVGWGASGRNGGQVTGSLSGDATIQKQLHDMIGTDANDIMHMLRWHGHDIIRKRVARYNIQCDLRHGHLHTAYKSSDVAELQSNMQNAHDAGLGGHVQWLNREQVHEKLATPLYEGGVLNTYNMHLHSLNLCLGEAAAAVSHGARIFEMSPVTHIHADDDNGVRPHITTANGRAYAKAIVIAGNAYHRLAHNSLRGLVFPAVLGNMTTEVLDPKLACKLNPDNLAVYDSRMVLDYYRLTADNRLMFGGGTNYSGRQITDVAQTLRPALEATFPDLKGIGIDYAWTGKAGIVINRVPALGRIGRNVFYAQGYSGHGIASSHIMAEIMAEAITGTLERFDVFSQLKHIRLPVGQRTGSALIALGMAYYRLRDLVGQVGR